MKERKTKKKLSLNKMTIALLDKAEINKIKGGEEGGESRVPTCQDIMFCRPPI